MNNSNCRMPFSLGHIDMAYAPQIDSRALALLELLSSGESYSTSELIKHLGVDPRGARQALTGPKYGHWSILNLSEGRKEAIYKLDERHLSGDARDDAVARLESRLTCSKRSLDLCRLSEHRKKTAQQEYENAFQDWMIHIQEESRRADDGKDKA